MLVYSFWWVQPTGTDSTVRGCQYRPSDTGVGQLMLMAMGVRQAKEITEEARRKEGGET